MTSVSDLTLPPQAPDAPAGPGERSAVCSPARKRLTVEVFADPLEALPAWADLEDCAQASFYQTRRFALPWLETIGRAAGMTPMIVLVRDETGAPAALLPLCVSRAGAVTIAGFIGGKDSNSNMGLYRPGVAFDGSALCDVLRQAAQAAGDTGIRPDLFALTNQPREREGAPNPMTALPHCASPSDCHSTTLIADAEAFATQRLVADARKKLRYKRRKLSELGPLTILRAGTQAEARRILEAFHEQKRARFQHLNIACDLDSPPARAFFERCGVPETDGPPAALDLYALCIGETIVATYGGGVHRGRFHTMINSFEANGEASRFSPADVLLAEIVADKCRAGLAALDLGIGEARYKQSWCDTPEPLFDVFFPVTTMGRAVTLWWRARTMLKRRIKQSRWAWPLAVKLRAALKPARISA